MEVQTKSEPKTVLVPMGKGGIVIISPKASYQINYLLNRYQKNEWSGIMVYKIIKGDLNDLTNLTFYVEYVFLKDIGSGSYTEFDNDGDTMRLFDEYPPAEDMRLGMIHSHHNMPTGFSGTDLSELQDNADTHLYYLSMIVSHNPAWSAKLVFQAETKTVSKFTFKNKNEDIVTVEDNEAEKAMLMYDVPVFKEYDDVIENRIKLVTEIVNARAKTKAFSGDCRTPAKPAINFLTSNKSDPDIPDDAYIAKLIPNDVADRCLRYLLTLDPDQKLTEVLNVVTKFHTLGEGEHIAEIKKYADMIQKCHQRTFFHLQN